MDFSSFGSLLMERRRKSLWLATLLVLFVGLSPMKLGAQASNAGALTGHVRGPEEFPSRRHGGSDQSPDRRKKGNLDG